MEVEIVAGGSQSSHRPEPILLTWRFNPQLATYCLGGEGWVFVEKVSIKNTPKCVGNGKLSTNFCLHFLGIMNWSLSEERKTPSQDFHAPVTIVP